MKKLLKLVLLLILVLLAAIIAINVYSKKNNEVLMFWKFTTFINTGSSMEPTITAGDLLVVKSCDKYEIDDVISFKTDKGTNTHRIIEVHKDGYKTKGDNNKFVDSKLVKKDEIYGKVISNVGNFTKLVKFIKKYETIIYIVFPLAIIALLIFVIKL